MALQTFVDTHVKFGSFVLPNILVRPTDQPGVRLRTSSIPNRIGAYSAGGVLDVRHIHVVGRIVLSVGQSMDDAWRELEAGLSLGTIDKLYTRIDDSAFRWAEVEALDQGDSQEGSALDYSVSFLCVDPFQYSLTEIVGMTLTIYPAAVGTYTLDHRLRTITRSIGDARRDLGASSKFFELVYGLNTITVNADRCTLDHVSVVARSCFR